MYRIPTIDPIDKKLYESKGKKPPITYEWVDEAGYTAHLVRNILKKYKE